MISKGTKKGTIRFSLLPENTAKKVRLVGDFSEWQPLEMKKQKDGRYTVVVALAPGTYEYKFTVEGQWRVDPDNGAWALNPYGTLNSVVVVE
ncbi:MAG: glycogen-binding domain-containing protein [Phycisphaerae bacterium]|jgi:1,4-alpha-glucan branching enzyme